MPFGIKDEPWLSPVLKRYNTDAVISFDDCDVWQQHRDESYIWLYNKLELSIAQDVKVWPGGIRPPMSEYPVICKPIMNLLGMGVGAKSFIRPADYQDMPGCFCAPMLDGRHVSYDIAMIDGEPVWFYAVEGVKNIPTVYPPGVFDYWMIMPKTNNSDVYDCLTPGDGWLDEFLYNHVDGYTGFINVECIGDTIIDFHFRPAAQWIDLLPAGFIRSMIDLYENGKWSPPDDEIKTAYSVPVWIRSKDMPDKLLNNPDLLSLPDPKHNGEGYTRIFNTMSPYNPEGRHRIAVINTFDLGYATTLKTRIKLMNELI